MKHLQELLKKAHDLIHPGDSDNKWILDKTIRTTIMDKHPSCFFIVQNKIGRDIPFPICNRAGMVDPNMVKISLKLAQRYKDKQSFEEAKLDPILFKLKTLLSRHNKEIPTPAREAAKKANTTKQLKSISNYLKRIN